MTSLSAWTLARARHTYSVPFWSEGYFDINEHGEMCVLPQGSEGPSLPLPGLVDECRAAGLKLPLLLRFSDILGDRLSKLQMAFAKAMQDLNYPGGYTAVYPIKVNQHLGVAGELAAQGGEGFGLEAGSKPELMAVLGLAKPGSIIICNGYKDREFIRLALLGRKLGLQTFIVVEKPSELDIILEEAKNLGVMPGLGVRMRLASLGAGKWQNSGGDKAKFGLSPRQVLNLVEKLKAANMLEALQLLHFHMGSQISNVRDIANGMREAVRYFVELSAMGCGIRFMDSGGGLAVDYEGTRSRGYCSMNYGLDQFAHNLIQPLSEACEEHGLKHPMMITEAGRAMTAHHAVMIANVSEVEAAPQGCVVAVEKNEPMVLKHLREVHQALDQRPALELFHEAQHFLSEGQTLYSLGQISLEQRAKLDDIFYAIAHGVRARLTGEEKSHRDVLDELNERLVDKYFVNFSVFESIPDVWAIDQVFPIIPISRLNEAPDRRGVIADLTCDSDGRIDTYVEAEALNSSLPMHSLKDCESYCLGIFMVGAYQEVLGDIHNLFGDTYSANIRIKSDGSHEISQTRKGDTTDVMLDYVGYHIDTLRQQYRDKISGAGFTGEPAAQMQQALEAGLTGYTYLHEEHV